MEKDMYSCRQTKFKNKKIKFVQICKRFCRAQLYYDFTLKTYINLLNSMLSKTLDVMIKVKQLFFENYLLLLHIAVLRSFYLIA